MSETKTKLKWYSIVQYEEEARWLEKMHSQGWKFIGVNMPCFYHFERCEPEDYVYQLDYNKNSSNIEYKQLFEDCGWEYLTDCMGYSYFRKKASEANGHEDIFCDDESRLDMVRRIFRGRVIPLLIIFFACIGTNLPISIIQRGFNNTITIVWILLALLYLWIFGSFLGKYMSFKKRIRK
ncbi:MAG: DUF2812 domain-containing protein [Treponema sp.]|nr:DUF2812 domain-containing protein [Treponema sp.]